MKSDIYIECIDVPLLRPFIRAKFLLINLLNLNVFFAILDTLKYTAKCEQYCEYFIIRRRFTYTDCTRYNVTVPSFHRKIAEFAAREETKYNSHNKSEKATAPKYCSFAGSDENRLGFEVDTNIHHLIVHYFGTMQRIYFVQNC